MWIYEGWCPGVLIPGSSLSSDQAQALYGSPERGTLPCDEMQQQLLGGQLQRAQSQSDGTRGNGCILGLGRSRQDTEKLFFPMPWDRSPERCRLGFSRTQLDKAMATPI